MQDEEETDMANLGHLLLATNGMQPIAYRYDTQEAPVVWKKTGYR